MDRKRLPLNALRAFEEVAMQRSFRAAADSLNVAQSALSRHVAALEQMTGVALFERRPRGLELTPAAEKLLVETRKAFDRLSQSLDEIAKDTAGQRNLRVYLAPSFANHLAVAQLSEFRRLCPGITLDITSLTPPEGQAIPPDAAVVYGRPTVNDKVTNLLWQVENCLLCAPELVAGRDLSDPAALEDFIAASELLHVRVDDADRFSLWRQFVRMHGLQADVERGLTFDTAELALRYALNGGGIALVDPTPFRAEIASARLVCPSARKLVPGYGYYLICDTEALDDPALALFRAWLISQFRKAEAEGA